MRVISDTITANLHFLRSHTAIWTAKCRRKNECYTIFIQKPVVKGQLEGREGGG
jgi:hypothetical protein